MNSRTKRIVTTAMLCAITYVVMAVELPGDTALYGVSEGSSGGNAAPCLPAV